MIGDTHMPQVQAAHYQGKYDSKRRFASYWHQINEILSKNPARVLEVGVGNGFVSRYLLTHGVSLTTTDHDPALKPDIVTDILKLPFDDESFDVAAAYEILEHLPYKDALAGLRELNRVSSRYVIISVPDATRAARIEFPVPKLGRVQRLIVLPRIFPKDHVISKSGHHWEIGKKDYTLKRVIDDIRACGFILEKTYRVFENPYHRFFILRKIQ